MIIYRLIALHKNEEDIQFPLNGDHVPINYN